MDESFIFDRARQIGEEMERQGDTAKDRLNVYACTPSMMPNSSLKGGCGYWMVTIDREAGVTPMFTKCGHCGGVASSRMYKVDPSLEPQYEWYRPKDISELEAGYTLESVTQHLLNGGLLLRPINKKKAKWIKPSPEIKAFIEAEQKRIAELMGAKI